MPLLDCMAQVTAVDLWDTTGPATHLNGTYEELLFGERCGLSSNNMALITPECGATRFLSIKRP